MDFENSQRSLSSPPTEQGGGHFQFVPVAGSTKLIIFFSGSSAPPRSFHFWKTGMEVDASRLYVNNGRNEWYQNGVPGLGSDLPTTIMNISYGPAISAPRRSTPSASAWAGTARSCSAACSARGCSPSAPKRRSGCQPAAAKGSWRRTQGTPFLNIHRFIAQASQPIYSLAGETDPLDLYCMSLAKGLPNYQYRSMNFVGHGPGGYLRNRERLTPLIRTLLNNEPPPPMVEDGFGCEIDGFAEAYYRLFVAYSAKDWAKVAEIGVKATALHPSSDFAQHLTGYAFLHLGQAKSAVGYLSAARSLHVNNAEYQWALAFCMRELGRIDLSINLHRRLLQTYPAFAKSHHALSLIFMINGALKQAERHARKAVALEPKVARYVEQAERAAKRLAKRQPGDIDKLPPEKRRIAMLYDNR